MSAKRSGKATHIDDLDTALSEEERAELEALMEVKNSEGPIEASVSRLHGFLTSVISGPLIMPSEYRPIIFGDSEEQGWEDINQAERALMLLTRFNNEVARDLQSGEFRILVDNFSDPPNDEILAEDWCRGYILGMSLREDEWDPAFDDAELSEYFSPIFGIADPKETGLDKYLADTKNYESTIALLPVCAEGIYIWWRERFASESKPNEPFRRSSPKISPNATCPCGSGKKYKRCCGLVRAT